MLTEQSETTLTLLERAFRFDVLALTGFYSPPIRNQIIPYNVLRVHLHDHFLNLATL